MTIKIKADPWTECANSVRPRWTVDKSGATRLPLSVLEKFNLGPADSYEWWWDEEKCGIVVKAI